MKIIRHSENIKNDKKEDNSCSNFGLCCLHGACCNTKVVVG
mgnify:CR=1 FL=1